jgi:hypothetical protein
MRPLRQRCYSQASHTVQLKHSILVVGVCQQCQQCMPCTQSEPPQLVCLTIAASAQQC